MAARLITLLTEILPACGRGTSEAEPCPIAFPTRSSPRRTRSARPRSRTTTPRSAGSSGGAASTSRRSPAKVAAFAVAVPTWGVGTGGTRFARFPGAGEPRDIFDKLEDCATIQQLTRATPTCSPHFPWDKVSDYARARRARRRRSASASTRSTPTRSRTSRGRALSYKFGSLTHAAKAVRDQAVAHNIECIEIGEKLGSKALTVWIADGSNFPGQSNLNRVFDWYLESLAAIYRAPAGRLARVPRAQALRAGLLFDRHLRLGHEPDGGRGARAQGLLPRRPRPPRAERQHRADRRPAHPRRQARGLPFQRFEIRRRRSRRRLDRPVPAVPRVQRTRRRRRAQGAGLRSGLHARPVAQRHRSDREPDGLGDRGRSAPMRRRSLVDRAALEAAQEANDVMRGASLASRRAS